MADQENHDVIDGDIPKDLGKKKTPIWVKGIVLGALVSVLGAATFVLNTEENRAEMLNATQGKVEDFMTSNSPSTRVTSPPEDEEVKSTVQIHDPFSDNALSIDINEPSQGNEISLDMNETAQMKAEISLSDEEAEVRFEEFETANPITITPASTMTNEPAPKAGDADADAVRTLSKSFASKESVEMLQQAMYDVKAQEQERINIIKSGIDMQTVSINRLNDLLKTLDGLKAELKQLNSAPQASTQKAVAHVASSSSNKSTQSTTAAQKQVKKYRSKVETPELVLLGVDLWGGEEFAQLQHNKQIHLLAKNESINGWRVASINSNSVTVVNEEGESFEIKK